VADLQPISSITSGFVELNQCQFYYRIAGHGHPLTLVHAGICDSRMWDDQWSMFAQQYQVIRFDMRGFGQSAAPSLPFAPHDDLRALLQFLGIRKTYLLGASLGSQVALDFTLAHPDMVAGLILVGPALTDRRPSDALIQQWSEIGAALERGDVAAANEIELRMWVDGPHRSPAELAPIVRERVRDMNAIKFDKHTPKAHARPLEPPAAQRLGDIGVPTLVVVGALDHPELLESAERLSVGIPGGQHLVMTGTAHLPNMEQPAAFNEAVQTFLHHVDHRACS
jgi:3-oxoadipate enol-lactonase